MKKRLVLLAIVALVGFTLMEIALLPPVPPGFFEETEERGPVNISEELETLGALALGAAIVGAVFFLPFLLLLWAIPH